MGVNMPALNIFPNQEVEIAKNLQKEEGVFGQILFDLVASINSPQYTSNQENEIFGNNESGKKIMQLLTEVEEGACSFLERLKHLLDSEFPETEKELSSEELLVGLLMMQDSFGAVDFQSLVTKEMVIDDLIRTFNDGEVITKFPEITPMEDNVENEESSHRKLGKEVFSPEEIELLKDKIQKLLTVGDNSKKSSELIFQDQHEMNEARQEFKSQEIFRAEKNSANLNYSGDLETEAESFQENDKGNPQKCTRVKNFQANMLSNGNGERQLLSLEIKKSYEPSFSKSSNGDSEEGSWQVFRGSNLHSQEIVVSNNYPKEVIGKNIISRIIPPILEELKVDKNIEGNDVEIRVKIKPESLGEVVIRLSREEGKISGRIFAESSLVQEILETNLSQLRQRLSEQKIELGELNIFLGSENQEMNKDSSSKFLRSAKEVNSVERKGIVSPGTEEISNLTNMRGPGRLNILA